MTPVLAAVGAFVAYAALVGAVWRLNRVRYDRLVESRSSIVRGIVVPIALGLALLVGVTTWLGWWPDALGQERRGATWAVAVPVLVALTAVSAIARIDWTHEGARRLPLLAVGVLLVGAAEELLARGLLVVGPQRAGWSLLAVWALSSALFALLHGLNGFFGLSSSATLVQIGFAFLGGTAFFVSLMSTGSLLVCMLLHAAWDFGTLGQLATERRPAPWQAALAPLTWLGAIVAVWFVVL